MGERIRELTPHSLQTACDQPYTIRRNAAGEYDLADQPHLAADLCKMTCRLESRGDRCIEIDFARVTFISASVVATLLGCQHHAVRRGRILILTNVSGLPAHVLQITDTSHVCAAPLTTPVDPAGDARRPGCVTGRDRA